tara:strand:- start:75 stop:1454 length:1380 start_codon:yes stop_codon:yes gene_type:complete
MATISEINSILKSVKVGAGFNSLVKDTSAVASNVQALNSTSLGGLLNETLSGVQSLNTSVNTASSIAILSQNIPGIQDQIIKDVSSSKTDLDAITGATVSNGFLDVVITCPTPEGVKASIGAIATPTASQTETIIGNITPKKYSSQVKDISTKDFSDFSGDFSKSLGSFVSSFTNQSSTQTGNPIQDILLQSDKTPLTVIENFGVPKNQAVAVLVLLQAKEDRKAIILVQQLTKKPIGDIETFISSVPITINEQLQVNTSFASTTGTYDVSSKNNTWVGPTTQDNYFDIIATQEQLIVEFIVANREITELVFYGHEMTPNQVLTAKDIHASYVADGNDGIPFHYVIQSNGNLQRGRPLSVDGTYSTTHDKYSVGIVVPHYQNSDASVQQGATISKILAAFYQVWPGGQVFDAQEDLDESQVSVGVSIASYMETFKKVNNGGSGRSFSTAQLISAAQGNV